MSRGRNTNRHPENVAGSLDFVPDFARLVTQPSVEDRSNTTTPSRGGSGSKLASLAQPLRANSGTNLSGRTLSSSGRSNSSPLELSGNSARGVAGSATRRTPEGNRSSGSSRQHSRSGTPAKRVPDRLPRQREEDATVELPTLKQFMTVSSTELKFLVRKPRGTKNKSNGDLRTSTNPLDDAEDGDFDSDVADDGLSSSSSSNKSALSTSSEDETRVLHVPGSTCKVKKPIRAPFERVTEPQRLILTNTSDLQQIRWNVVSNASTQFTVKQPGNKKLLEPGQSAEVTVSVRKHAKELRRQTKLLIQYGSEGILLDKKKKSKNRRMSQTQFSAKLEKEISGEPGLEIDAAQQLRGQSWKGRNLDMLHSQTLVIDISVDLDIPRLKSLERSLEDTNLTLKILQEEIYNEKTKQRELRKYRDALTETHDSLIKETKAEMDRYREWEAAGRKTTKIHFMHFFVFCLMLSSTFLLGMNIPHFQIVQWDGGDGGDIKIHTSDGPGYRRVAGIHGGGEGGYRTHKHPGSHYL